MNLLTAEYGTRLYLASFAKVGNPFGEEQEYKVKMKNGVVDGSPGSTLTTQKGTQKDISSIAQNQNRGALSGLTPSEVDVADRVYRGRNDSLGLQDPNVLQRYASSPTTSTADQARLSQAITGKTLNTPEDLLKQAIANQRTATVANDTAGLGSTKPLSLSSSELGSRSARSQSLIDSRDLDEFYRTINSGGKPSRQVTDKARTALQNLTNAQRTSASPLDELLNATKDVAYLTDNAKPALPVKPTYIDPNSTDVSYKPKTRQPGQVSGVQRRADRLTQAKDYSTRAAQNLPAGGVVTDDLLYTLAGQQRPPTLGEKVAGVPAAIGKAKQDAEARKAAGIAKRQAAKNPPAPKPSTPANPLSLTSAPTGKTSGKAKGKSDAITGKLKVGNTDIEGEVNIPKWLRGKAEAKPKVPGKLKINNPIDNGSIIKTIRDKVSKLAPSGKAGLLAGGAVLGGAGLLGGGALLANNNRIKQEERQRQLDIVAQRPPMLPQNQLPNQYMY
jgi:hypothetical protein